MNERIKPAITPNALKVLQARYLRKNEKGEIIETPEEMFERVAFAIASAEEIFSPGQDKAKDIEPIFYDLMASGKFMPNSPTLMNAGREMGMLAACFTLPLGDSIADIFDTVKATAMIQKAGGGTGFSFDRLRPSGAYIKSSGGTTSGPISFWKVLSQATESIQQGCFVGDTQIGVPGGTKSIKDIKKGDIVYSYDEKQGKMVYSKASCDAFMTKKNTPVWKLTTDKGLVIFATPEHLMMTRSGKYEQLQNLKIGQRLMPLSRYNKSNEWTISLQDGKDTRIPEHRMLGEYLFGSYDTKAYDIHHKNGDHLDNSPENLVLLTKSEHHRLHGTENGAFFTDGCFGDRNGMHKDNFWKNRSQEELKSYRHSIGKAFRVNNPMKDKDIVSKHPLFNDPKVKLESKRGKIVAAACALKEKGLSVLKDHWETSILSLYNTRRFKIETVEGCFGSWDSFLAEVDTRNHVVTGVEFSHTEDVWDFEVEGTHNFCVVDENGKGIVAHNSFRRGANMGAMTITHPDIISFIFAKQDLKAFTNFNISVKMTDEWMRSFQSDPNQPHVVMFGEKKFLIPKKVIPGEYSLSDLIPYNYQIVTEKCWTMQDVMDAIVDCAWSTGEPGILFIDTINKANTTPNMGEFETTNPCSELPLLPYEACTLGSIDVAKFYKDGKFDWDDLSETIGFSIRFLDNVVEVNKYPLPEIEVMCKGNRKVGLGVMGFADLLFMMEIPYNSAQAVELGRELMRFINDRANEESCYLGGLRGTFPNIRGSVLDHTLRRNAGVTTIAPTGTISIIANCSGGIEPLFSLAFVRQVLNGQKLIEINPYFEKVAKERGFYSQELMEKIAETGTIAHMTEIPEDVRKVFVCSHDIEPDWHIAMQAAFQENNESSISKTINLPNAATKATVLDVYLKAWKSGCKGVTVYRDGCRDFQPMSLTKKEEPKQEVVPAERTVNEWKQRKPAKTPIMLSGIRVRQATPFGHMHINITIDPKTGREMEIFAQLGKAGDVAASDLEAIGRMSSLFLRMGGSIKEIVSQLDGMGSHMSIPTKDGRVMSLADGLAKGLRKYQIAKDANGIEALLLGKVDPSEISLKPKEDAPAKTTGADGQQNSYKVKCPECGGNLTFTEGCIKCHSCGYSKC